MAISAAYTAVSLAAASLTERRAVASAGVILVLLISGVATTTLVEGLGADERLLLANLSFVPFELVQRIYGQAGGTPALSTLEVLGANLIWTLAGLGLLRERYRRLRVTR